MEEMSKSQGIGGNIPKGGGHGWGSQKGPFLDHEMVQELIQTGSQKCPKMGPEMVPERIQNGPKRGPQRIPLCSENLSKITVWEPKRVPKGIQKGSRKGTKRGPKSDPKTSPKGDPEVTQNESKSDSILAPFRDLDAFWAQVCTRPWARPLGFGGLG